MVWYFRHYARKFFRTIMKPIAPDRAAVWNKRFQYLYVLSGFTFFLLSFYKYYESYSLSDASKYL